MVKAMKIFTFFQWDSSYIGCISNLNFTLAYILTVLIVILFHYKKVILVKIFISEVFPILKIIYVDCQAA